MSTVVRFWRTTIRACQVNTGEFLRHGHYQATDSQRLQPRTAWKAAFDVSTAALLQISAPTLMMKSASTNLLRATVHPTRPMPSTEIRRTTLQSKTLVPRQTACQLSMKQTSQVAPKIATIPIQAELMRLLHRGWAKHAVAGNLWLSGKQPERLAFDPSHLSLPFSS